MPDPNHGVSRRIVDDASQADPQELVMGLHWDPPQAGRIADPVDLDALCVLFDAHGGVIEVVHPDNQRSAGHGVVHTGDSRTGASAWDDERIFVFLNELPPSVSALAFIVVSASGHAFDEVRGAFCHVSDRESELERIRLELTSLAGCTSHAVATLRRGAAGWRMATDAGIVQDDLLAQLRALRRKAKNQETPRA